MGARWSRRQFVAAAAGAVAVSGAARPVNVVMFMTDDHGAWATGAYGCRDIHTPNIDRLAAGGATFTRAFACTPVCSPSRATFMTGRLPSTHGIQDYLVPGDCFGPASRRWIEGQPVYSELLAAAGYTLGMCGKWHLGGDEAAQAGFSYWATVPGGGGTYRDPEFVRNGARERPGRFKTDAVGDYAIDFLNRTHGRPFYLLVPFYAPHTPYDYQPPEYRKQYDNSKLSCFPAGAAHPWQNPQLRQHHLNRNSQRAYSALVTGADHNIGRIVERLEELGVRDNTLVVFTADQGWNAGHHGVWGKGNGTLPFNAFEESIRVPLIWNHPGRIAAGTTIPAMVSSYDYFPAILDYLGVRAPRDPRRIGRSYAGFLRGRPPRWENRLYFEYCYLRALRTENLKYILRADGWPSEMFDLEADPGETRNVIGDPVYRKQAAALRADLDRFFRRAGAPPAAEWRSTTEQNLAVYPGAR